MPNYGNKRYWDKRYKEQKGTVFEWLENYSDLKELINKHCPKDGVILNLGCGNSIIQEDMYDDGFKNIYNIDISPLCIQEMDARKLHRTELIYEVMDCTELKYKDETFDFVIDKSTIDALLCGNDSYLNVAKMISEVQRVLKPGGIYLIVSYGEPYNRTFHFERNHLDFSYTHLPLPPKDAEDGSGQKQNPHYAYILTKGPQADSKYLDYYEEVILELIQEEAEARLKYGTQSDDQDSDNESENEKIATQEEVESSYKNGENNKDIKSEKIKNNIENEEDLCQKNVDKIQSNITTDAEDLNNKNNNQNEENLKQLHIS